MPTQIKINLCFKSVLGMTLNYIRWGSFGSGTEWCYPLPSLHPGPLWPGVVQPVRAPIKGTSWPASARGFALDSILGEHKHRIQTSRETTANHQTHHFSCRQKPSHLRSHSTRRKMTIYFKRRVSSIADSLKSLYAMSSCGLQNEINGFLNCLIKVFSFVFSFVMASLSQQPQTLTFMLFY